MANRITGMYSGLDTENLIKDLVKAKSSKVTKYKSSKTKAEWKQDKWKELNKKVKSLQSKITSMQFSSDYMKKKTTVSNSSAVSVITGEGAMNSVQSLKINKLAKSGYLTGAKLEAATEGEKVTSATKISELAGGSGATGSFSITTGGKTTNIDITADTTIDNVVSKLKSAGVSANFDATNGRIFIGASASGKDNDFALTANDANGLAAMNALGINAALSKSTDDVSYEIYKKYADKLDDITSAGSGDGIIALGPDSDLYKMMKAEGVDMTDTDAVQAGYESLLSKAQTANAVIAGTSSSAGAIRLEGSNAEITLNGATFESASNNIEVNGLTFTCLATTAEGESITVTTQDDTDGIYDMIKSYIKEYSDLINEMDKLYNAPVNKKDVLTEEEKEALSESEAKKWDDSIKDSLLRGDSTLGTLFNGLRDTMAKGYTVGDKTMHLSDFGIGTLSYFEAADNEKSAYHIDGDKDDSATSGNADKLKSMIASDPNTVVSFFTSLSNEMNKKMSDLSKSSDTTSFGAFYEDKKLKTDLTDWDSKIADAEDELNAYEDKWYAKFSAMEVALSKMDSKNSYLSGLFTK